VNPGCVCQRNSGPEPGVILGREKMLGKQRALFVGSPIGAVAVVVLLIGCGPVLVPSGATPHASATATPTSATLVSPSAVASSAGGVTGISTTGDPAPTPVIAVVRGQKLALAAINNGAVITVAVGTEISVNLAAWGNPPYTWTAETSDNPQAIRASTASQETGSSAATFVAVTTGTAILSATNNPNCHPCRPPSEHWQVTVHVVSRG
jgi:hypothetical protein